MQVSLIYYLTAAVLGSLHALEPGHGKTVVAAYLIGSRGRKTDAVLLGLVVTMTHTFSVILLAIAAKIASNTITLTEESLHGYLGLVAGLLILAVGVWMLLARLRGQEPFHFHSHDDIDGHSHDHGHPHSHDHDHEHAHHSHNPGHSHDHNPGDPDNHGHGHNHVHLHGSDHDHDQHHHGPSRQQGEGAGEEKRVSYWQLFLLGVSGGMVPCPAAIAILLAAVAAGKLGEGLTYILLFSLGLAAALIIIGMMVVSAGKLASRFLDAKKFARKVAIASAGIITLIGVVTVVNSLRHVL
jgi:nickel/cobalt exporter